MDIAVLISLPSVFILLDMFVLMKHNFHSISLKQLPHPLSKTSPYYSSKSPYVIPTTDHPSSSSPRSPISSPSSVSHLSPTSQTSPESSNGQPSPISTTSIPTLAPPTPPPPPPISQWVYRLKRDKNGSITCYRARFIAKGFQKQPSIDFPETFSPVVKLTTIRAVLSLAVTNNWPLRQLDVHNAFLHGNLKEQASRAWFECLSKALFDLDFKGSKTDPSLFIYSRGHTLLYIQVYVDDIIVTGNKKGTIDNIISQLGFAFALKDLGPLNYFLGIKIVPYVFGILLSQKKYILELLQSDGLSNCNPVSSPMVTSSSLSLDDNTAFSNLLKDLLSSWYRLNMVCFIRRTSVLPGVELLLIPPSILTDVLWKGNPDTSLEAFSYADWAGDSDDRRHTTLSVTPIFCARTKTHGK
ncbi:retrovirus-related pol polyprotein from transposon TNT 1-94 [Tanacetum coccineum]